MNTINKRPNYFTGQFLKESDFQDEQAYHMAALREHNAALHTWGIAEGLEPSFQAGALVLKITGGLAIDSQGRHIRIDAAGVTKDLTGETATTLFATLTYAEKPDPASLTGETGVTGHTRIVEEPALTVSPNAPQDASLEILLCTLTLKLDENGKAVEIAGIDESQRKKSGIKAGDLDTFSLGFITDQMSSSLWPKLSSANINNSPLLTIDTKDAAFTGQLKIDGAVGIGVEPSTVAKLQVGGALKVNGNATLDQNLNVTGRGNLHGGLGVTGATDIAGKLTVTGDAAISGSQSIGANVSVGGNLTINGNLDVKGTTTTVNTAEMEVADNIIRVNKYDAQATPKNINGGLEVFRGGTAPEAQIVWDETEQCWKAGTKSNIQKIISGESYIDIMPIGTIINWHRDLMGTSAPLEMPLGWVECNGQTLSDPESVLNGKVIPNLNSEGRFLRGGNTSGNMQAMDWKSFSVAGFTPGGYTHGEVWIPKSGFNTVYPFGGKWEAPGNLLRFRFDGSEVRPINMSIIFLIKVKHVLRDLTQIVDQK